MPAAGSTWEIRLVRPGGTPPNRPHIGKALAALDRDPFQFAHLLHRETAALTAETAVLDAAERRVRLVRHGAIVEMNHAGVEAEGELHRFLHVIGDDAGGEAVIRVVGVGQ
jgi:hypothetical protein